MNRCACEIEADLDEAACPSCGAPTGHEPARCDCCGAPSAVLIREPVEGVICERCPECRERGEVP